MPIDHCPCFNLGLAHRKVARAFEEALSPLGLTVAQAHFLSCLFEQDAQLSRDLARELGVDAGTLTPMVDRLEKQGLVRRCPHPADRRASRICLEPRGRALKPEIEARSVEVIANLTQGFEEEDYAQLIRLLKKMSTAADTAVRRERTMESAKARS